MIYYNSGLIGGGNPWENENREEFQQLLKSKISLKFHLNWCKT